MQVNWYIESYEGGEGVLIAKLNDGNTTTAYIRENDKQGFVAYIYEHEFAINRIGKTDNSLVELMAWVEEELKFRWSHD